MQETNVNDIAILKLREYFKLTQWSIFHVNEKALPVDQLKLGKYVSISTETYKKDWCIIEIIQKKPILNEKTSMGDDIFQSFDSYAARYAVNIYSGCVERLENKELGRTINLDACANIESNYWTLRSIGDKYKTIILKRGIEERFKLLSEAKPIILKMITEMNYEGMFCELSTEQFITFKEMVLDKIYSRVKNYLEVLNEKKYRYK